MGTPSTAYFSECKHVKQKILIVEILLKKKTPSINAYSKCTRCLISLIMVNGATTRVVILARQIMRSAFVLDYQVS